MSKIKLLLAVLVTGLLSLAAHAASFDCAKAGTSVEKMICSDQELSDLDERLSGIYKDKARLAAYPGLKKTQRDWLHQRNQCSESECLKSIYQSRIEDLSKLQDPPFGISREEDEGDGESLLSGSWKPGSRAYEGRPGEMEIHGNKISYIGCTKTTFSIISNKAREDSLWNGVDKDNEVRHYQDVVIALSESPNCKDTSNKIMRFIMPSHIAGYANLMLYTSEQDYKNEKFNAWGSYHYSK